MNKLAALLNIETGEKRLVGVLFLHSFLLGIANNFVQTAAFALFMIEFDAQALAWVYVANALLLPLLTYLYLRLGSRLSFSKLLAVNLGFLFLLICAFRLGMGMSDARWLIFALPILFQVLVNFGNLEFWTLAGRLFNVRQAKRLFGLVGAGQWLAIVLTGLLIPLLVRWMGTANMLFISAAAVAGALGLMLYITRNFANQLTAPMPGAPSQEKRSSSSLLSGHRRTRYVILIFVLVVLWWLAFFYIDNIFFDRAAVQYPDSEQLASFLGIFLAGLGIVTLFNNTFLSGLIIGRYGVRASLLILPVVLVASASLMVLAGTFGAALALLFWLTVLAKLLDMSIGFSIDRSALTILYQPLPPEQRGQAQTVAEGIFQPLSNGLAGLSLLALSALFAANRLPLVYVLLLIIVAWLVVAILVGRQYPAMLMQALTRRRLGGADLSLADRSSLEVLQGGLQSPHPGVVIYSMNQLEAAGHSPSIAQLKKLLVHPTSEVRQDTLQRIERLRLVDAHPAVEQCIEMEPSPSVRSAAVRTLATLSEGQAIEKISNLLDDPDPLIQRGAMVGLLCSGGIAGILAAGHKLLQMAESPQAEERATVAQVLGEVAQAGPSSNRASYYQPLIPLLKDDDQQVQRAALLAAGNMRSTRLWPLVLKKLDVPSLRGAATVALAAGGESVLPEIDAAFKLPGQSQDLKAQLVKVCSRIGGEKASTWLKDQWANPDETLRGHVLQALDRCGYHPETDDARLIHERIRVETALAAETLAILVDIGEAEEVDLLRQALLGALVNAQRRIFFLLSFLYDRDAVLGARDNLDLSSVEKKAYALEILDVLIPQDLKQVFFPLISDLPLEQKSQKLAALFPEGSQPTRDCRQRLEQIIAAAPDRFSAWTRACAIYAASRLTDLNLDQCVATALAAQDPLVRETAIWAMCRLDNAQARRWAVQNQDPNPQVFRAIQYLQTDQPEELMLSTLEKVITLKKASIFAETPDETLVEVASLLEEISLDGGKTIFEKGDIGDCMYIIVDGEVRVHDGERTLNHLYSGDVFGESAVLDSEPRMASITAVQDTLLLRLEQEPFYEVMESRSEVARGIIRVLTKHLRERVNDLNELRAGLEVQEIP